MDPNPVRISPLKILLDLIVLILVGTPLLLFFLVGAAFERGFYCDDESLRHPYKESTVPSYYLYIFGPIINLAAIIWLEYRRRSHGSRIVIFNWEFDAWIWEVYLSFSIFIFGAFSSQLIVDSFKYSIGRLRPHFYTLCDPTFNNGQTCLTTKDVHKYITDFKCSNPEVLNHPRRMKEMRLSFPSGHSSFSMYTMLFFAIYLQARMKCSTIRQLKHLIQYLAVLAALLVAGSRISDYKHHWSDVLTGLSIGALTAIIVARFVSNWFVQDKRLKSEMTELGTITDNGNTTINH